MKQSIKRVLTASLLLSVVVTAFAAPTSHAAEGESIALTPTSKRYEVDPGEARTDTFSVVNDGTEPYSFTVYARPYSVKDSTYAPDFGTITPTTDVYKWVQFEQSSYTLAPGEKAEIPFTLRVPQNIDSGGYYGVLFAETQPADGEPGSVVRKKRVGAIVYATVKGDNQNQGTVERNSISLLQTSGPLSASASVKNTGNVDFVDTTTLVVRDIFGNEKYKSERALAVLPGTTRDIQYAWQDGPSFGLYKATVSHAFLDDTTTKSTYVLLAPLWLVIALAVLIIGAIGYRLSRRTTKKVTKKKRATKRK